MMLAERFGSSVLIVASLVLQVPLAPAAAQSAPGSTAVLSTTAGTGNGEVGQRQESAAASINTAPTERISNRIETRVESRLQTRIDRGYAVASTPAQTIAASQRARQVTTRPR